MGLVSAETGAVGASGPEPGVCQHVREAVGTLVELPIRQSEIAPHDGFVVWDGGGDRLDDVGEVELHLV